MNNNTSQDSLSAVPVAGPSIGANADFTQMEAASTATATYNHRQELEVLRGQIYQDLRERERSRVKKAIQRSRKRGGHALQIAADFKPHIRVLRVFGDKANIIAVEDPYAGYQTVDLKWICEMVATRAWKKVSREPLACVRLLHLSSAQIKRRDRNVAVLQPIIDLGEDMFDPQKLSEAVATAVANAEAKAVADADPKKKVSAETVYRLFRLFLQAGCAAGGLIGRWFRGVAGADGRRHRIHFRVRVRDGESAPIFGRPRKDGSRPFAVYQEEIDLIVQGARKYYHTELGGCWHRAWLLTVAEFFLDIDRDKPFSELEGEVEKAAPDTYPSEAQFRYWAKSDALVIENLKKRHGKKAYNLKFRPLSSHTESGVAGPGAIFLIDPTKLDVVSVHQLTRKPIGRLTFYLVVDAFSRMIVGYFITTRNPGYDASSLAILCCATNKVTWCAQFGVTIKESQWPCHCLPEELRGDSEVSTLAHHRLVEQGVIDKLTITPAYRADLKGLVEALLGSLTKSTIHHLPGVSDGARYRCQGNPDDLAVLDLVELNRIAIFWILQRNRRVLDDYQLTPEMIAAGITKPTPLELWNYGTKYLTGRRKVYEDLETLKMQAFPMAEVDIGPRGLEHDGLFYWPTGHGSEKGSSLPEFEKWCALSRKEGLRPATITYNPGCVDEVWFHHGDRMIAMELAPESREAYSGWTIEDLSAFRDDQAATASAKKTENVPVEALLEKMKADQVKLAAAKTELIRGNVAARKKDRTDKVKERQSQEDLVKGKHRPPASRRCTPAADAADQARQDDNQRLAADLERKRTNPATNPA
jgi:hypothetical protein